MTRHRARSIAAAILLVALAIGFAFATRPPSLPTFSEVRSGFVASDLRLFDRRGELLHERRVGADSRSLAWVPLEVVSPALIGAVIASEDRRFREHGGIDVLAMAAAARDRLLHGSRRGASTISMQLAALVGSGLSRRDSSDLLRKLRQIRAARAIESSWSKDEILEAYLNLASFRGELRGVGAAARGLFERSPAALGGAEAAVLAALLRAPNAPVERVAARAAALAASTDLAAADEAASRARRALSTPPGLAPAVAIAPHLATRLLAPGGGDVRTTIDANVQRLAIRALREQLVFLADRNVRDGAVLVVENATGEVLAWVGSSGDLSPAPLVDGVRARRQAGSTLKPFLYALAFEERLLTPTSLLDDSPLEIATATGIYRPENYDRSFRGLVPARVALASSLNVPAVRVAGLVGVGRFVERLAALGFDELRRPDYYGESVALGSADVTLAELVNAYRTLVNAGEWTPLRVSAAPGVSLPRPVVSREAAFLVLEILADRSHRSATFGFESPLSTPFFAAVKTGTSKDMRDNWCIGSTRRHTVGVWVGNFSGAPMQGVSGIDGAAPAWLEIVRSLEEGALDADGTAAAASPEPPAGIVRHEGGFFLAGTEPVAAPREPLQRPRRIRAPSDGAQIAIDPDIPGDRQRVFFESDPPDAGLEFRLDGAPAGAAGRIVLWPPAAGRHRLDLVDTDGGVVDSVRFEVR